LYYTTMSLENISSDRKTLALIAQLSQAVRCCQQDSAFCENVSFSQFYILDSIAQKKTLPLSDLHSILSVDKSTTTRLVHPLVKRGLVTRKKNSDDSRAVELSITPDGEETLERVWNCFSEFLAKVQNGIPAEKRQEVFKAVRLFLQAMAGVYHGETCACKSNK